MTTFTLKNRISIAILCFYAPTLFLSAHLFLRHVRAPAAWFFLSVFATIRLSSAALELATIDHPASIPILSAAMIMQNIGISPLMLVLLALVGQAMGAPSLDNDNNYDAGARRRKLIRTNAKAMLLWGLRIIQLLVLAGLALSIAGGVTAANDFEDTGILQRPTTVKVGLGLICTGYGLLVFATGAVAWHSRAWTGGPEEEWWKAAHIVLATALALPFVLVRVVYGCLATYLTGWQFNPLLGNAHYFLGMAVVMEMCVVVVCLTAGYSLPGLDWLEGLRVVLRMGRSRERKQSVGNDAEMEEARA